LYSPNQKPGPRLGIIIPKHHIKRAVDRNLIRRLVRESFRHQKESLKGLDIIVLLRSKCTPLDKKALRDDIDKLWLNLKQSFKPVS
jgi:ribonuclease P protein component